MSAISCVARHEVLSPSSPCCGLQHGSLAATSRVTQVDSFCSKACFSGIAPLFFAGMVDMANEVFATLQPHLQHSSDTGQQVLLGGHSLGGALAVLVASLAQLQLKYGPQQLSCTSFGSPPVLRHAEGKGEADILQVRPTCLPLSLLLLTCWAELCTVSLTHSCASAASAVSAIQGPHSQEGVLIACPADLTLIASASWPSYMQSSTTPSPSHLACTCWSPPPIIHCRFVPKILLPGPACTAARSATPAAAFPTLWPPLSLSLDPHLVLLPPHTAVYQC